MGTNQAHNSGGNELDIDYSITPNQESCELALISVVPYKIYAPIPEAKKDSAIVVVLAEDQADRKKSWDDPLLSDLGTRRVWKEAGTGINSPAIGAKSVKKARTVISTAAAPPVSGPHILSPMLIYWSRSAFWIGKVVSRL